MALRLLAISGSLREGSLNTALLRAAAGAAPEGVRVDIFGGLRAIPPFDEDQDEGGGPVPVAALREALVASDGLLIATPEYNSSVPGVLKNALDWASRPYASGALRDLPVAVIGASSGAYGAVWAQEELRKILRASGARVLGEGVAIGRAEGAFGPTGELARPAERRQLEQVIRALADDAQTSRAVLAA